jgi:hypothetical protein
MTTAATLVPVIGAPAAGNFFVPDSTQRLPLGATLQVTDPYFGGQELMYVSFPPSTALKVGHVVVVDSANSATAVPNTANLGQPVAFVLNAVPSVAAVQYGWVVVGGRCLALSGASVAANAAIGITAAGSLGAVANGKQILGAKVQVAATGTITKANTQTQNGSTTLKVTAGTDGMFVGQAITGTGVGASAVVSSIDPDNKTVVVSVASTATGSVTITGTNNDSTSYWNTLQVQRPHAQGQVT